MECTNFTVMTRGLMKGRLYTELIEKCLNEKRTEKITDGKENQRNVTKFKETMQILIFIT